MEQFDKFIYINELLDLYGSLLTTRQLAIMRDYYVFNLSFSEIADNRQITRSAVSDSITKTNKKLENYEEKLQCYEKKRTTLEALAEIKDNISDPNTRELLNSLERKIKNGI